MLTLELGESTMSRTKFQLWNNRFKQGLELINDDSLLGRRVSQKPIKTLKQRRKLLWIIVESLLKRLLMMLPYRSANATSNGYNVAWIQRRMDTKSHGHNVAWNNVS